MSKLDKYYRISTLNHMFTKGWGNLNLLQRIIENHKYVSKRESCKELVKSFNVKTEKKSESRKSLTIEGCFESPFNSLMPDVMDKKNQLARFQLLIPKVWSSKYKPLCIHYAGTGDQHYSRRKMFLANRLLEDGIASLIHINPFYGIRKPNDQKGSCLNYLSDLFIMGGALVLETQVLLKWAKMEGFEPLAVHGISMGGHMACLGVSVYPEPVCLIPCLSWTTASHVFTQGVMSSSVPWDVMSNQYYSDAAFSKTIREAIESPISETRENNNFKTVISNINEEIHFTSSKSDNDHRIVPPYKNNEMLITDISNYEINDNSLTRKTNLSESIQIIQSPNQSRCDINSSKSKRDRILDAILLRPKPRDSETLEFMRLILDYFTHLGNFSVPFDTRLATIVVAGNDAYIPREGVSHFHEVWDPRCEIRIKEGIGHVEAYLRSSFWIDDQFRKGIVDTMNRYIHLYYNEIGPLGKKKM